MAAGRGDRAKTMVRVLVADNTPIHTQLLAGALRRDRDLEVISCDSNVKSITEAALKHDIDVLVISSSLEEQADRGLEVLRRLHVVRPRLRTVVLLDSSQVDLISNAFRAGARGVLSRVDSIKTLSKCIRCVHQGQVWASGQHILLALQALADAPLVRAVDARGLNLLSKREREIVQCLTEGLTNREIAEQLRLSEHTVKNYLFRVFDKTGASSRIELICMILTRSAAVQSPSMLDRSYSSTGYVADATPDAATMTDWQQAAEEGVLIAQLALAQCLLRRKATSRDTVDAYKWYLIASGLLLHASKSVSLTMTMEQLLHAEQMASDWLKKMQRGATFADPGVKDPHAKAVSGTEITDLSQNRDELGIRPKYARRP